MVQLWFMRLNLFLQQRISIPYFFFQKENKGMLETQERKSLLN